ncbi:MAG: hypothetical protein U0835_01380 [Isosphaeraceae bacterium]
MARPSSRSASVTFGCVLAASMALTGRAHGQGGAIFAQPTRPFGIVTDSSGNVVVNADHTFSQGLEVYRSNGALLTYLQLGGFSDISGFSRLARLKNGRLLALRQDGVIQLIDPPTGKVSVLLDVKTIPTDYLNIYDLAQGRTHNFSGTILPQYSSFGDLAILERSGQTDLILTGLSQAQAFPFVIRVRITSTSVKSKVIAASSASTAGTYNASRGIAVNSTGLVLTTLPYQTNVGSFDRLVTFSADFPETRSGLPAIQLKGTDFSSAGMTTDSTGVFYVATSKLGTSLAGSRGSGALVKISSDGKTVQRIFTLGGTVFDSRDVAISPANDRAYMTVNNYNAVVTFSLK